jgi:hypothetical protein
VQRGAVKFLETAAAMSKQGAQAMALLLNAEIAGVLASMRQNSKWSLVPMRYTAVRNFMLQLGMSGCIPADESGHTSSMCTSAISLLSAQEDDLGDEPLLEDFRLLRRRIFKWSGTRRWQQQQGLLLHGRPSHISTRCAGSRHSVCILGDSKWPPGLPTQLLDIMQTGALWSRWSTCHPFWRSFAAQRPRVKTGLRQQHKPRWWLEWHVKHHA